MSLFISLSETYTTVSFFTISKTDKAKNQYFKGENDLLLKLAFKVHPCRLNQCNKYKPVIILFSIIVQKKSPEMENKKFLPVLI